MKPFPLFCAVLLLLFLFLFLASRGESPPGRHEVPVLLRPFRRLASLLFFRVLFPLFGEQCLAGNGKALRHLQRRSTAGYREEASALFVDRLAAFLAFLFLAACAGLLASFPGGEEAVVSLERPKPSDPSREEELIVRDGEDAVPVSIRVSARDLLPEEEEAAFAALLAALPGRILGANETLDFVTTDLSLPASADGFPFRLSYTSSDPEVLGPDGHVRLDALSEGERRTVLLTVEAEGEAERFTGEIAVCVCRPEPEEAQKRQQAVLEAVRQQDEATRYESHLILPEEAEGRKLSFYRPEKDTGRVFFALLVIIGLLSWLEAGQRAERAEENRERELVLSFPRLVSLLLLYAGAGMSLRTAFERAALHLSGEGKEGCGRGALLEEVEILCNELRSGIPEEQAYQRLGERTGVRQYMRLASLLSQNVRKGNDTLLSALRAEADAAYAERRDTARVLGEEAGTKLLLPMMLLLAACLLPVILPAMWTFR